MRRFNKEACLEFILLVSLSAYILYLLATGKAILFIHPKRLGMLYLAVGGLLLLSVYKSTKLFTIPSRKSNLKRYIPLSMVLLCGVFSISSKAFPKQEGVKSQEITQSQEEIQNQETIQSQQAVQNREVVQTQEAMGQQDTLVFDESNYLNLLSELEAEPHNYRGKKIIVEGMVYKEEDFDPNCFIVGRFNMLCCAADAQFVGLMSEWGEVNSLKNDDWIRIEGILDTMAYEKGDYKGDIPLIKVIRVVPIEARENPYVY